MSTSKDKDERSPRKPNDECNIDRLRRTTTPEGMSVELVSAFAGDRSMTEEEKREINEQQTVRGLLFYSDLFYAISHHYFAPEIAETLWGKVLKHKHLLSEILKRNIRITVATLDFFSNINKDFISPTVISEENLVEIAKNAMRDRMTGLYNHTSFYELLELEFRSHRRYGAGVSIILLDIDDFKAVNDRYGHQAGDQILIDLAKVLKQQVRDSDICCRFGGEEFVVVLPFTSSAVEVGTIAERIRVKAMELGVGDLPITISLGVAICDHSVSSPHELIEHADRALYRAKRAGKNRVAFSTVPTVL
ncbi:MAG: hypothetical protein A2284_00355 [Deltaproteobacteria bacterium RIFOXYA12_FULL_61_11]|nr:MAG: hypothetical protein A2284_00355 [Deltaproteobacteria bacterium RIFOXYA12_FULL_61_11]